MTFFLIYIYLPVKRKEKAKVQAEYSRVSSEAVLLKNFSSSKEFDRRMRKKLEYIVPNKEMRRKQNCKSSIVERDSKRL